MHQRTVHVIGVSEGCFPLQKEIIGNLFQNQQKHPSDSLMERIFPSLLIYGVRFFFLAYVPAALLTARLQQITTLRWALEQCNASAVVSICPWASCDIRKVTIQLELRIHFISRESWGRAKTGSHCEIMSFFFINLSFLYLVSVTFSQHTFSST